MYQLLSRSSRADNSPFHYARAEYLRSRMAENFQKLVDARQVATGRLDSRHILLSILINLNVDFDGDIIKYMTRCDEACKRLCGTLGITSSFSHGRIHQDGWFYNDLPEIIIYTRNPRYTAMDLWKDWRGVTPIEVTNHPITSLDVVELGVKNSIEIPSTEIAVISIDIPLLAAQWKMFKAAYPDGTMEKYLTSVPLANMVKSHLNVAFYNRLIARENVKKSCPVRTNLTFAQTPVEKHADDLMMEIIEKVGNKTMTANQIMDSIPVPFGTTYLDTVNLPSMTPTYQVEWALIYQKIDPVAGMLELASMTDYSRMTHDINVIRRTLIQMKQEQTFDNGQTAMGSHLMTEALNTRVVARLPKTA